MSHRSFRPSSTSRAAGRVGLAALLALVAGLACGGGEETASAPSPSEPEAAAEAPRRVGAPGGGVAQEAEQQAELLQGTLPKGFPSDVPRFPGSKADSALSLPGTSFVSFTTDSGAEDVLAYYRRELRAQGWSVGDAVGGGLKATKEGREVTVRTESESEGEGSSIALSITGG